MYVPGPQDRVWVNGRWMLGAEARLPRDDPGLLAGLGLFETLAIEDDLVLDLEPHLLRLTRSARELEIPLPAIELLMKVAWTMPSALSVRRGWLKVVVTRGRNCAMFGGARAEAAVEPASAVLLPWRRDSRDLLSRHKSLSYGASVLGRERAASRGADEGLWLNQRGHLTEGCSSNLFVVKRRTLYTGSPRVDVGASFTVPFVGDDEISAMSLELVLAVRL